MIFSKNLCYPVLSGLLALSLISCNEPPLYNAHAREFLRSHGESKELIANLKKHKAISPEDATRLAQYENVAVLHLIGANPTTPIEIIKQLAQRPELDIRTGIAVNPSVPLDILMTLRSPKQYSTENSALATNPSLPQHVIWDMYNNNEAEAYSFAANPNCPSKLMRKIFSEGDQQARLRLAFNPSIPEDLMQELEEDSDKIVRNYLSANPSYQEWKDKQTK